MAAILLEGQPLASKIKEGLKKDIDTLKSKGFVPHLAAVQVGENAASKVYINQQKKSCEEIGIVYELKELPAATTENEMLDFIDRLNQDDAVTGVILMMPLPKNIDARRVQVRISPDKNVEGIHPVNMGRLVYGEMGLAPCTARAAVELLKSSGVELKGKEVVVVGHSEIVGKPIALMLLASQMESPTPTVCHIATKDLRFHTKRADVILVAVGKPGLIKADMVKDGVIVIDIGINRVPVTDQNGKAVLNEQGKPKMKTTGDVDFEAVKEKASFITPVPGGVGPVTTTMLLYNTVESAKLMANKSASQS
ncbi:MAG: bifunctional 5,10-methylenetetrahydrofolate dehydrogenase/5,10-methenyltetrahydrofolate cyclohydrolase [Phycisphaerae bacterium]|jgi:methylenetetrahydrofolate dehydrogenase (NADP+)/methenyltetrahydrofolate cyclohydrolase